MFSCLLYLPFNNMSDINNYSNIASFLFELGLLNNFKRSGFDFLGTGSQNVSSHSFRTAVISYVLAKLKNVDVSKTVLISLFHDIPESRTGDINYFQKKYVSKDEERAVEDIIENLPLLSDLKEYIKEFNNRETQESIIAGDADTIELIITLKEELDKGNKQAEIWINDAVNRLKLEESRRIVDEIIKSNSYDWWMKILGTKK